MQTGEANDISNIVQKLDGFISMGDALFQQDTDESINRATQCYLAAMELLTGQMDLLEAGEMSSAEARRLETLNDRLFKIRHCRSFDGSERELPLFAPPIDPARLVAVRSQEEERKRSGNT